MWKQDPLSNAELSLECSRALHRQAGIRGLSCMPKRSHINRGTYYAEINRAIPTGQVVDGIPTHRFQPNVAMGTGATPTLAAMNGYKLAGLNDPLMLAIYLEIELHYLAKSVKAARRIEAALDDLTAILRSAIVLTPEMAGKPAVVVAFDEDDDL